MFDLQELHIRTNFIGDNASATEKLTNFVGIKRNNKTGQLEFCLPKGFENFPSSDFNSIKKLFFRTYRTYRKFFDEKNSLSQNESYDGFSETANGYRLVGKDETIATYSKLNVFDSILDAYNDLLINSLQKRLSKSSNINYARIDQYLHRGIYLDDDTVYIDEMEIPKQIIDLDSPTLVQMFCYIYCELKHNVFEEEVDSDKANSLSQEFKEKYLGYNSSLFDQETFSETITILKDTLDNIDKFTAYKDEDYWHFYEAIYTFLYGENQYESSEEGTIWGLDNFSFVWEELCFNYATTSLYKMEQILFADRFGKFSAYNDFLNPFIVQINGQHKRYLRPDLVVIDNDLLRDDFLDTIKKVFEFEPIELNFGNNQYNNLKLIPVIDRHNYQDLWSIYTKWVEKNPSVIRHPEKTNHRNVADQHKATFIEELMKYFYTLKTQQLIVRRPLLYDFLIVDYKYVAEVHFQSHTLIPERQHDIKKQLVYEMALQSRYETKNTRSEFWIPAFFSDNEENEYEFEEVVNLNSYLTNNGITVLKMNFEYLQEIYLMQ